MEGSIHFFICFIQDEVMTILQSPPPVAGGMGGGGMPRMPGGAGGPRLPRGPGGPNARGSRMLNVKLMSSD